MRIRWVEGKGSLQIVYFGACLFSATCTLSMISWSELYEQFADANTYQWSSGASFNGG